MHRERIKLALKTACLGGVLVFELSSTSWLLTIGSKMKITARYIMLLQQGFNKFLETGS
jgi:hypothetical protein